MHDIVPPGCGPAHRGSPLPRTADGPPGDVDAQAPVGTTETFAPGSRSRHAGRDDVCRCLHPTATRLRRRPTAATPGGGLPRRPPRTSRVELLAAFIAMFGSMSDTYTVQRSVTVNAPPERVYPHIIDFHQWADWSPWDEMDPDMEKTFSGPDAGKGARYAWSGNRKVGQGNMEITDAAEASSVQIALEFLKPFKASNTTVFSLEPADDRTNVTWAMTGQKTFMTRVMGIFRSMDSMVGPDFEKGLARLKAVSEAEST